MSDRSWGVGADSGEHCAWALVERDAGVFRLLALHDVYGDGRHWLRRAQLGAGETWAALLEATGQRAEVAACVPVWVEEPPAHSKEISPGKRIGQQAWVGLGRRVGMLETLWWVETAGASVAERHPPSDWYDELHRLVRRGKSPADGGRHRVTEAGQLVAGAAAALARVPASRVVDAAESVLVAAAASKVGSGGETVRPKARRDHRLGRWG